MPLQKTVNNLSQFRPDQFIQQLNKSLQPLENLTNNEPWLVLPKPITSIDHLVKILIKQSHQLHNPINNQKDLQFKIEKTTLLKTYGSSVGILPLKDLTYFNVFEYNSLHQIIIEDAPQFDNVDEIAELIKQPIYFNEWIPFYQTTVANDNISPKQRFVFKEIEKDKMPMTYNYAHDHLIYDVNNSTILPNLLYQIILLGNLINYD